MMDNRTEVVAYVTETGSVRQPASREREVGWWFAAMVGGHGLGNYQLMNGETCFVIQDRCQPDRLTLGLSNREWDSWVRADRERYWPGNELCDALARRDT